MYGIQYARKIKTDSQGHCGFLVPSNRQKILTEIWHQFWDKNDGENIGKIYAIEIIFKSNEPFQSFQLAGPANSARKAG